MVNFQNLRKISNNFPTDQPIPEKQGRVRGNKNIFKVGLNQSKILGNGDSIMIHCNIRPSTVIHVVP